MRKQQTEFSTYKSNKYREHTNFFTWNIKRLKNTVKKMWTKLLRIFGIVEIQFWFIFLREVVKEPKKFEDHTVVNAKQAKVKLRGIFFLFLKILLMYKQQAEARKTKNVSFFFEFLCLEIFQQKIGAQV